MDSIQSATVLQWFAGHNFSYFDNIDSINLIDVKLSNQSKLLGSGHIKIHNNCKLPFVRKKPSGEILDRNLKLTPNLKYRLEVEMT